MTYAIYEPSRFNWREIGHLLTEGDTVDEVIDSATSFYADDLTEENSEKEVYLVTYDSDGNEQKTKLITLKWDREDDYSGESVWNKAQLGVK